MRTRCRLLETPENISDPKFLFLCMHTELHDAPVSIGTKPPKKLFKKALLTLYFS